MIIIIKIIINLKKNKILKPIMVIIKKITIIITIMNAFLAVKYKKKMIKFNNNKLIKDNFYLFNLKNKFLIAITSMKPF